MVRRRSHTGRPLGAPEFLTHLEAILGRTITPGKRGLKTKRKVAEQNTGIINRTFASGHAPVSFVQVGQAAEMTLPEANERSSLFKLGENRQRTSERKS